MPVGRPLTQRIIIFSEDKDHSGSSSQVGAEASAKGRERREPSVKLRQLRVIACYDNDLFHDITQIMAVGRDLAWFGQLAQCQIERTGAFVTVEPLEVTGNHRAVTDCSDCAWLFMDEFVLVYAAADMLRHLGGHNGVTVPGAQVNLS